MENTQNDSNYYLKINGELVSVTEEKYRGCKRLQWAESKRKKREPICRDINGIRCKDDCRTCDKSRIGAPLSLQKFMEDGLELADPFNMENWFIWQSLVEAMYIAIGKLNPRDRAITMLYSKGYTEREIAAKVGLSQKGVNKAKVRIFTRLGEQLKIYNSDD